MRVRKVGPRLECDGRSGTELVDGLMGGMS